MYCPNCGYKNDEDADFCEHCGSRLEPGDVSEPSPGKKRGNLIVAVLAAVICVGIAGILVYLLVLSPEKENKSFTADASYQEEFDVSESQEEETDEPIVSSSTEEETFSNTPTPTSTPTLTPTVTATPTPTSTPVPTESSTPVPTVTATPVPTVGASDSDYIIPDSSSRILSRSEIESLSDEDLRLAINEIYARHGRKFQSEELQTYFNGKAWYHPSVEAEDFTESMLNETERQNVMVMAEIQNSRAQ